MHCASTCNIVTSMQLATWRCIWSQAMSPSAQQEMPGRWRQTAERCWRELLRCRCQWLQLLTVTGGSWMIVWAAVETFTVAVNPQSHEDIRMVAADYLWLMLKGILPEKRARQMSQNLNTWPAGCCASSCSPSWQPGQLTPPGKSHRPAWGLHCMLTWQSQEHHHSKQRFWKEVWTSTRGLQWLQSGTRPRVLYHFLECLHFFEL